MIKDNVILQDENDRQLEALMVAQLVLLQFIARRMQEDLNEAFVQASGEGVLDTLYNEILQEIRALHKDEGAREYVSDGDSVRRAIDFKRLDEV